MKTPPEPVPSIKYSGAAKMLELSGFSRDAELAHRRLCDWHWSTGEWPTTLRHNAAALCRVPEGLWAGVRVELARLGWRIRRGRLTHSGVHQARAQAASALNRAESAVKWAPSGAGRPKRLMASRPVLVGLPMGTYR